MNIFEQLINLVNYLIETDKLICRFEEKWSKVLYKDCQFTISYYDYYTSRKIYNDLYYNPSLNVYEIDLFENGLIETITLQDTKEYILFDLGKKDFILINGKELKSGIFIEKETDILLNSLYNIIPKVIVLDNTFISDKLQQILNFTNFEIQYSNIEPLFVNYYTDFMNSITNKLILAKTIITINEKDLNDIDIYSGRYIPLLGYYITFNIYDDFCKHLSNQILNDLSKLKTDIVKLLTKYEIVNNYDFVNIHTYKKLNDKNNCYITIEIDFDYKHFLDILLLTDTVKIIQKL